jgi:hypothetical protein
MDGPFTLAIATAVAGKAAESLTEQARDAVAAITRRIREKFRGHPAQLAALDAAQADQNRAGELAGELDEAIAADPAFGDELRRLWDQAADVVNVFRGQAQTVVQLRDVHGDLRIGG